MGVEVEDQYTGATRNQVEPGETKRVVVWLDRPHEKPWRIALEYRHEAVGVSGAVERAWAWAWLGFNNPKLAKTLVRSDRVWISTNAVLSVEINE